MIETTYDSYGGRKSPILYRMTVHIIGATSSPSCANFVHRRTAQGNEVEFDSDVVKKTVNRNVYVDDCLTFKEEANVVSLV